MTGREERMTNVNIADESWSRDNTWTADNLNVLVAAGASLAERIACGVYDESAPINREFADLRLTVWQQKATPGNAFKFEQRLAWDGLEVEDARRILGSDPLTLEPPPYWVPVLRDLLRYLADRDPSRCWPVDGRGHNATPFADALVPVADFGMAQLEARTAGVTWSQPVADTLKANLLGRISGVCALTLGEEFLRFRTARGWRAGQGAGQTELYSAFTTQLGQGGLMDVFTRYPALARLAAIAIANWVSDMADFAIRLEADRPGVASRFFRESDPGPVQSIQNSLSDPHRGGRTVKIVTFENGRRIVYKPKSLAIDEAWANLVAWLGKQAPAINIRTPNAWSRGEYGWVEYIEALPCESGEAVRHFYTRAGMLTCLLYGVIATDFHHENLIASADHPVPIDLETLFVPRLTSRTADTDQLLQRILATVLQCQMLPSWQAAPDCRTAFDTSGLGGSPAVQDGGATLTWININTDAMQFTSGRGTVKPSRNMPSLRGEAVDPGAFVPDIIKGFTAAYRALIRHREELLAVGGPLEAFRECYTRIVLRPTQTYASLLRRSLTPRLLRNGVDRSLEFEVLSRTMLMQPDDAEGALVFRSEVESLEQLDTPYFDAITGSDVIRAGTDLDVQGKLAGSAFDAVIARLRSFSEADLDYQSELIRASFAARDPQYAASAVTRPRISESQPAPPETLLAEAETIAAHIARRAIWQGDAAYWIAPEHIPAIERYALQPIGTSLYSGRSGIAVFLAAVSAATDSPEYRRLALAAARSVVNDWVGPSIDAETAAVLARAQGIGGATGTAGVVYGLVATARLLGQPELLDDAIRISRFVTPTDIEADNTLDVIGGTAGAILGLLPLWQETRDSKVYDRIAECGEHLVAKQIKEDHHAGGWPHETFQRPLTGFSHGAAGMAYALLKAHAVTGHTRFREAAHRGVEFERSVFVPAENSWPDFRPWRAGKFGVSWCHGAPGIGLARLGSLPYSNGEQSVYEIDRALDWLLANPPLVNDHLCCGEFGNIELLLEAGRRLDRPELTRLAGARGASAVARANYIEHGHRSGFQSILGPCEPVFIPGLFDGLAGIGYQMLRLAFPSRIASVLLWD